jgi:hypothetical protein
MSYKPSNSPVFADQQSNLARKSASSDARIAEGRRQSIEGRKALFNTLMSPEQIGQTFGTAAGVNAAKLQDQSEVSRGTGILGAGILPDTGPGPSIAQIIQNAPEVVPLSFSANYACGAGPRTIEVQSVSAAEGGYAPHPGMPKGAPMMIEGPNGPLYYEGPPGTYPGAYAVGRQVASSDTGGITGWIADHPWLTLGLAGVGVFALSRRSGR